MRTTIVLLTGCLMLCACAREKRESDEARFEHQDAALERAQYFLARRLPAGMTQLPTERYAAAQTVMRTMAHHVPSRKTAAFTETTHAASQTAATWEWLGPANVAGRMRTLVFHPTDSSVMYTGGVSGGVWISRDAGANWQPVSDDAVNLNIGALAIDANNPNVLYAGTGELYRNSAMPWSPMRGAGILKSTDAGQHWTALAVTATSDFFYVSDIQISPHDSNRLYAATNTGVWRSNDAGVTFQQELRPMDAQGDLFYEGCTNLAIRSDVQTDWVLASCASRSTDDRYYLPGTILPPACPGPCPAAVFLNTDVTGAGHWNNVLSETGQGKTTLDIHRANQSIIYAAAASIEPGPDRTGDGVGDYDNGLHAIFRSNDGGQTWQATVRNTDPVLLNTLLFDYTDSFDYARCRVEPFIYGAGWYNNTIAVDPVDPDVVWVGGMDIFRSDDGGHNWGMASHYFTFNSLEYVHPDQHLLKFHPQFDGANNRLLYALSDGGIARTQNARAAVDTGTMATCGHTTGTIAWQDLSHGLGTTQFYTGAVYPDGQHYLGGAQDNSTLIGSDASGRYGWRIAYGGDGGFVAIDPTNTSTLYVSAQYVSIGKSTDGGATFADATRGLNDSTLFVMPYLIDPSVHTRLFAGGTRLWRSDDGATNWRPISAVMGGTQFANLISAIAVAPANSNRVLVGNQVGIFRNDQALASTSNTAWQSVSPRTGWVSWLAFDPSNTDVAYATYSTFGGIHVWKTTNAGASWQPLDGSGAGALPDIPVHALVVDPGNSQHLYIGTDVGLFVSLDGGLHWNVEDTGYANVITEALAINTPSPNGTPMLYAFTYGRGVWRTPLASITVDGPPVNQHGISGTWYNPATSGQGLAVEVYPDNRGAGQGTLFAGWFTYAPGAPGGADHNRWFAIQGPVTNVSITSALTIYQGVGGNFAAPPIITPTVVGTATLKFSSCMQAQMTYQFTDGSGLAGTIPLSRLTANVECTNDATGVVPNTDFGYSGAWYDHSTSGQGFLFELNPSNTVLFGAWYTYAPNGASIGTAASQRWYTLQLNGVAAGQRSFAQVPIYEVTGGVFNTPPGTDQHNTQVGTATVQFTSCGAATVAYQFSSGSSNGKNGSIALTRVGPIPADCAP